LISRESSSSSNPKAEDDDEDEPEKNENKIPVTSCITGYAWAYRALHELGIAA